MKAPNGWTDIVQVRQVRERSVRASRIRGPLDVARLWINLFGLDEDEEMPQEHFVVVCLDTQNVPASVRVVTTGLLNSSLVHPREVFNVAILSNAASIICVHNHPSGDADPSPEDLDITEQLVNAGRLLGIPVRDHIIVDGRGGYCSLLERGLVASAVQT